MEAWQWPTVVATAHEFRVMLEESKPTVKKVICDVCGVIYLYSLDYDSDRCLRCQER